jgi:hypothetical protein
VDNTKGATTAFATFSAYRKASNRYRSLLALALAPLRTADARKPAFLHTAQFVRLSPRQLRRAGLSGPGLEPGALLFISAFNGDAETYFRGFSDDLYKVMDQVWRDCVEWQNAKPYPLLAAFIEAFRRRSNSFFCAYPAASKRIRSSLRLRRQLDKLCALALSGASDEAFKAAFERAAQLHWGNAEATRADL